MTTEALAPAVIAPGAIRRGPGPVLAAIEDTATVTWRNLKKMSRMPQLLVFATVQPIIFVLMFRYVFGGAIKIPGVSYVDYLMPGIFAQTVVFGSLQTGVGLAEDLRTGLIERFRALPMARMAVLAGRTIADLVRNVFVVLLMLIVGYLVGWRLHTNVIALVGGIGVILLFSFALTWLFAIVGLATGDPETAQAASFPLLAPLVFASTAFVPLHSMPGWLQAFAANQPVSVTVDAVRDLTLGGATTHDVSIALVWSIALVATFAPLAVARYRRAA
jgi:ABC-2 type transport system permease protein/oleandomycin transport system permease protein